MDYKTTQRASVPNLKLFGLMKTEFQVKEVAGFYVGKWAGGHSSAHQHGYNMNVWVFSKL